MSLIHSCKKITFGQNDVTIISQFFFKFKDKLVSSFHLTLNTTAAAASAAAVSPARSEPITQWHVSPWSNTVKRLTLQSHSDTSHPPVTQWHVSPFSHKTKRLNLQSHSNASHPSVSYRMKRLIIHWHNEMSRPPVTQWNVSTSYHTMKRLNLQTYNYCTRAITLLVRKWPFKAQSSSWRTCNPLCICRNACKMLGKQYLTWATPDSHWTTPITIEQMSVC